MVKIKQIKLKSVKEFLKKPPRRLAEHAFLTSLFLILIALALGAFIFYKYDILVMRAKPGISEEQLQFQEKTYQEILKIWENRQKRFQEAELKEYPDLFRGQTLPTEGLTQ